MFVFRVQWRPKPCDQSCVRGGWPERSEQLAAWAASLKPGALETLGCLPATCQPATVVPLDAASTTCPNALPSTSTPALLKHTLDTTLSPPAARRAHRDPPGDHSHVVANDCGATFSVLARLTANLPTAARAAERLRASTLVRLYTTSSSLPDQQPPASRWR